MAVTVAVVVAKVVVARVVVEAVVRVAVVWEAVVREAAAVRSRECWLPARSSRCCHRPHSPRHLLIPSPA